jgi:hypothetical protein
MTSSSSISDEEATAIYVRNALFPLQRDYGTKNHQHHQIHPALTALDRIRKDLVDKQEFPFSNLFPRRVMLVRTASSGEMDWNGQPDIDDATIEVVPDVLSARCMPCNNIVKNKTILSFLRSKERYDGNQETEVIVCSDRVLQNDYKKQVAAGKDAQVLTDEKIDLPANTMKVVEETLAHELRKVVVLTPDSKTNDGTFKTVTQIASAKTMPCEKYAGIELMAAKAAECMFEQKEGEKRRGSRLRPVGFSLLPGALQQNFQNRCAQEVAKEFTSLEFGSKIAASCVKEAFKNTQ